MELRYRILAPDDPSGSVDVEVAVAPDATVGEAADAIADHLRDRGIRVPDHPTLAVVRPGGSRPTAADAAARDELVRAAAPACGATVVVVRSRVSEPRPPVRSPASLLPVGHDRDPVRLPYGASVVGPACIEVSDHVSVRAVGSAERLEVDGAPVAVGTRLAAGDLVRFGDHLHVLVVEGPLRPPATSGPVRRHAREPAVVEEPEPVTVELPTPPGAGRLPGFPVLSATVPLLMGAALWVATRSIGVAGFVLFSFVFVLASAIEGRREAKAERRFREDCFRQDLADADARIVALRAAEAARAGRSAPALAEVAGWAARGGPRVWERRGATGRPLTVRLGQELVPGTDPVLVPHSGRRDLVREASAVADRRALVEVPATIDLDAVRVLGLVGPGEAATALARSLVAQLVGLVDPRHLDVEIRVPDERRHVWDWVHWLPHHHEGQRADGAAARHLVVAEAGSGAAGALRQELSRDDRVRVLWLAPTAAGLPDEVGAVARLGPERATIRRGDGPPTPFDPEPAPLEVVEPLARRLAPLRAPGGDGEMPARPSLADVLEDRDLVSDPVTVAARWERARSPGTGVRAPVGATADGAVVLDLDVDGPHALVAGTTGSGKSELLRTLVTSFALHHPPDRVTFLLVDYKGGAAFGPLVDLPHVVGVVTDLGPDLARRALVSLRAELRRRERIVARAGADELGDRAAALVVVVDEFATLARDVPDVVDGLLDVAQRGRSLGIHLVLATQRPGGVVTDAIRANLTLRLALRVADEGDSADVVDTTAAAHLPADVPGRAVLRIGPGRTESVQVAHTGAPAGGPPRATCRDLHAPFPGRTATVDGGAPDRHPTGPTQLDVAVGTCRAAAVGSAVPPPHRPWLAPLPDRLDPVGLPAPGSDGELVLGLLDRPEEQSQPALRVDLASSGGLLVLGAPGSGRTATLGALARAASSHPSASWSVHGLDGARGLGPALLRCGAAGADDVVPVDDVERTLRLLRWAAAEVDRRGDGDSAQRSRVLLLVDSLGALDERHARVNRGEAVDLLVRVAADGRSAGIHVAVTASRRAEVPPGLLAALDRRLLLRCASPDDASMAGAPPDLGRPDVPAGRCWIDGALGQVAAPDGPAVGAAPGYAPAVADGPGAGRLPQLVRAAELGAADRVDGWSVALGLRADTLAPARLDLGTAHALVVGPPRSGRTAALRLLAHQLASRSAHRTVFEVDGRGDGGTAVATLRAALAAGTAARPSVVLLDDLPDLLDGADGPQAEALLLDVLGRPARGGASVRLVASAEADELPRCYSDVVRRLRSGRTGILLRPDPDLHPPLLHTVLPPHDELAPSPGRGWLVTPDGVVAVQLAVAG